MTEKEKREKWGKKVKCATRVNESTRLKKINFFKVFFLLKGHKIKMFLDWGWFEGGGVELSKETGNLLDHNRLTFLPRI